MLRSHFSLCSITGFFLYTFPDEEESEMFIKASVDILNNADIDATLLYFLQLDMDGVGLEVSHKQ